MATQPVHLGHPRHRLSLQSPAALLQPRTLELRAQQVRLRHLPCLVPRTRRLLALRPEPLLLLEQFELPPCE